MIIQRNGIINVNSMDDFFFAAYTKKCILFLSRNRLILIHNVALRCRMNHLITFFRCLFENQQTLENKTYAYFKHAKIKCATDRHNFFFFLLFFCFLRVRAQSDHMLCKHQKSFCLFPLHRPHSIMFLTQFSQILAK